MQEEVINYEGLSRKLDPQNDERDYLLAAVKSYSDEFLNEIYSLRTYTKSDDAGIGIYDYDITEDNTDISNLINALKDNVDSSGINPASGGHLAYIPGGGLYQSALGDFLAAIFNRYAGANFASPGAVRLENMLLRWMNRLVGYPEGALGNLASGGSIANLIGIVTAREATDIKSSEISKSVIYLTEQAHHSIKKSIRIAGLRECIIRNVPMDGNYRMKPEVLEEQVINDFKKGLNPFLVISSAGTTDTGSIDPLAEIGEICHVSNLWHHIDAAYGGFFLLSDLVKDRLKGIDMSDSVVMDPHKGLFLPYGTGAVLVRKSDNLLKAFSETANYMQDKYGNIDEISPMDVSPEMSKHFRGLRLWLPLKLAGLKVFRAALNEKVLLSRYFYEKIKEIDGFEVGPEPELSIVTYRYIPRYGDANEFNRRLIQELHADGRVFLSSTTIDSKFLLRLVVLHFRTHLDTIELALELLKEKVKILTDKF